nr:hypothetical protein [Tanacetum cinerariifolium]
VSHRRHPTAAQAAQVIGVDFKPDAEVLAGVDDQIAGRRTHGFRQYHRCAAVQQSVRLMRAMIDHHAGGQGLSDGMPNADQLHRTRQREICFQLGQAGGVHRLSGLQIAMHRQTNQRTHQRLMADDQYVVRGVQVQ